MPGWVSAYIWLSLLTIAPPPCCVQCNAFYLLPLLLAAWLGVAMSCLTSPPVSSMPPPPSKIRSRLCIFTPPVHLRLLFLFVLNPLVHPLSPLVLTSSSHGSLQFDTAVHSQPPITCCPPSVKRGLLVSFPSLLALSLLYSPSFTASSASPASLVAACTPCQPSPLSPPRPCNKHTDRKSVV